MLISINQENQTEARRMKLSEVVKPVWLKLEFLRLTFQKNKFFIYSFEKFFGLSNILFKRTF